MKPVDFEKAGGLVPVIIQDDATMQVLMLGYMNQEALEKTIGEGKVTFFSRSKNRLWTKGETSGNFLYVKGIIQDCDNDAILIKAEPAGPTCHMGTNSCFGDDNAKGFLYKLEKVISQRIDDDEKDSYTNKLFKKGINKVAQKVGEEAVELVIEAKDNDMEAFRNEAADLFFHTLILLRARGVTLEEIEEVLKNRHKPVK
jgi:phosphoribosyl-AMP cyclohydrolase / phosphoribosyl-ATP pyrophosphohydrolase